MDDLIQYAIPAFVILLPTEVIVTAILQKDYYETRDTMSSLSMGTGNIMAVRAKPPDNCVKRLRSRKNRWI